MDQLDSIGGTTLSTVIVAALTMDLACFLMIPSMSSIISRWEITFHLNLNLNLNLYQYLGINDRVGSGQGWGRDVYWGQGGPS